MKIIQTPVRFFPAIGGVEKYVLDASSSLADLGHEVTVVCANIPKADLREIQGVQVKRLPSPIKLSNTNVTPTLPFELFKQDFDLIHTHLPTPWCAEISLLCARYKNKPCVLTYHNDVEKSGLVGILTRVYNQTIMQIVLAGVDKILITQPRYLEDSKYLRRHRGKVAVIPNGIRKLPDLGIGKRGPSTLLFVGILDCFHRYKGLDVLIKAMGLLKVDWPHLRLQVVGTGDLVDEYRALARKIGVEDQVLFIGRVEDDQLFQHYQLGTIFILPSIDLHEGFGIVLLEAMSFGMPVITTETVGISQDIRAYETGLIVPLNDPVALSQATALLLSDPQLASKMGRNGRELVRKKYLWEQIVVQLDVIYKELSICNSR